jgi:hypothetical protein
MTVQYTMNTDEDQSLIHILMFVRIMLIHYIKWKYCIQNTLYDNYFSTCIVCLPLIINIKFSLYAVHYEYCRRPVVDAYKIFSIWLAHDLGSGMDSKNNKNPYTVIFFSLHV